ncbi:hypothetical protein [Photobacterium rosenbergii]|uniref:hypothetical protein n=1 Tax=Photobacterium rosenbergii TaxID=294936 RepID=UPI001C993651|nr:hypothetical protein [Photobacterium rosenbergii]MBY5946841.1 hypothetical protein [Photobacterium rosenbergii]
MDFSSLIEKALACLVALLIGSIIFMIAKTILYKAPPVTPKTIDKTVRFYCGHGVTDVQKLTQFTKSVSITCSDGSKKHVDYL